MKKLKVVEITKEYINQRYNEDLIEMGDYFYARDVYNYRKRCCDEANCDNHYEIVQVKITDDEDKTAYYGVLDTAKGRLV